MAAFVIPASVSADSFVAAPSSRHLRASAPTVQAASAPSTGSAGSALAAVALAGAVAVGAAGARRARRAQRVAVRAENPRADKLRTMEKTVQAGGSENPEVLCLKFGALTCWVFQREVPGLALHPLRGLRQLGPGGWRCAEGLRATIIVLFSRRFLLLF